MACDALEFGAYDANVLRALRHRYARDALHRAHIGEVVGHAGYVVHSVGERNDLYISPALGQLLRAAVQVAEYGLRVHNDFAVEGYAQSENAVRAGMLRPQVDGNGLSSD